MFTQKYIKGKALFSRVHGDLSAKQIINALEQTSPELAKLSIEWIFGDIYARPQLDIKLREIANIAALVVLGNALPQVENHVRSAMKVGCTPDEIKETMLQMVTIAGFPAVVNAMLVAKKIFDEAENSLQNINVDKVIREADILCFQKGWYEEAFLLYGKALEVIPNNIIALSRRANILRLWKRYDEALKIVNSVLITNKNYYAYYTKIRILAEMQQNAIAKKLLSSIKENNKYDLRILQQKAAAESALGFHKKALETCKKSLCLDPNDAGSVYTKGIILEALKKYEDALLTFHYAIHLRPGHLLTIEHIKNCRKKLIRRSYYVN